MKKPEMISFVLLSSAVLAACSDDTAPKNQAAAPFKQEETQKRPLTQKEIEDEKARRIFFPTEEEKAEDARKLTENDPVITKLPNPGTEPQDYLDVNHVLVIAGLYYSNANESPNLYSAMQSFGHVNKNQAWPNEALRDYIVDFENTNDEFEKRDIARKAESLLNSAITNTKSRYVKIDLPRPYKNISNYNFDKVGFEYTAEFFEAYDRKPGNYEIRASIGYGGDYEVVFSNGPDYKLLTVSDEAAARSIEKLVNTEMIQARAYGYVESLQQGELRKQGKERIVEIHISKIELYDRNNPDVVLASVVK